MRHDCVVGSLGDVEVKSYRQRQSQCATDELSGNWIRDMTTS